MKKFLTVEEFNMRATVEATPEEKTQVFQDWVKDRVDVHKTLVSVAMHNMDYCLNEGTPMRDDLVNNKFESVYSCINEDIQMAKAKCEDNDLSDDVLSGAIKAFKQMKSVARKVKAEYQQRFAELNAAIEQAKADGEYVASITQQVQEFVADWCHTYALLEWRKAEFGDEKMPATVARLTNWVLSRKLRPSNDDVTKFLEEYMGNCTMTVAS